MDILKEAKKIGKIVLDKGVELGKVTKIRIDIASMKLKISDYEKEIGEIIYKEKIDTGNEDIKKTIEKIDELMKDIENKKKKISSNIRE